MNLIFESELTDGSKKPNPTSPALDRDSFCRSKYIDRKFYEQSAYAVVLEQISMGGSMVADGITNNMATTNRKDRPHCPTRMMVRQSSMPVLMGRTIASNDPFRPRNCPVAPVVDLVKEAINDTDFDFFSKTASNDDWFLSSPQQRKSPSKSKSAYGRVARDELAMTWHPQSPHSRRKIEKSSELGKGGAEVGRKCKDTESHGDNTKNVQGASRTRSGRMIGLARRNSPVEPLGSRRKDIDGIDSWRKSRSSSARRRKHVNQSLSGSLHTPGAAARSHHAPVSELDGAFRRRKSKDSTKSCFQIRRESFDEAHHESTTKVFDSPIHDLSIASQCSSNSDESKDGLDKRKVVKSQGIHRKRDSRNTHGRDCNRELAAREPQHRDNKHDALVDETTADLVSELMDCLQSHSGIGNKAPVESFRDLGNGASRVPTDEESKNNPSSARVPRGQSFTFRTKSSSRSRSRSKSRSRKSTRLGRQKSNETIIGTVLSGTSLGGDRGGVRLKTSRSPMRLHSEDMIPPLRTNDSAVFDDHCNEIGSSCDHAPSRRVAQRKDALRSRSKSREARQRRLRRVAKSSDQDIPVGSLRGHDPPVPKEMSDETPCELELVQAAHDSTRSVESTISTPCGIANRPVQIQCDQFLQSPSEASDILDDDCMLSRSTILSLECR